MIAPSRTSPRRTAALVTAALAFALGLWGSVAPASPAAAEEPERSVDGLSQETAAASCWEIKQEHPSSPSGVYWLVTPALGAPEEFYCDQERSGGGWVLVGRGREAWSVSTMGSGTPAQVRSTVTGPAAFSPKQLPGATIDALANNEPIGGLDDGVRLVRARNTDGSAWHDMTFTFASPRDNWTWQFNNQQRVGTYKIGTSTFSGGQTSNFGRNNDFDRVRTITGSYEGWHMGFGFGSQIRGNPSASSYLWSKDTSTGYARPFTQVYIRPKLMSTDIFDAIPEEGTPAETGQPHANSFTLPQSWGVAGLGAGPSSIEGSNEVSAFTESGDAVFVGGNFTSVQQTASGSGAVQQRYLAAFNRDTGEWISSFRPTFNNQVKALVALPGGRIAAGGYFTEVNGEPRAGLAVLDAETGALDPAFTGRLINYLSGGVPVVRTLDAQDGWLYAAGSFTHSTGGSSTLERYTRAAARFDVSDGTPDGSWNPELNGTVMSVDASERGDRVYFAGFFSESKGRPADKGAALSAQSEELFPWSVLFSNRLGNRSGYQQAVLEVGDRIWLGGSEHSLFSYSRDTFEVLSTTIGHNGGDFQAIASDGNAVYGGCHCFETQYEGASTWPSIGTGWTEAQAIYGTGAWDASTGRIIPDFNGILNTRAGAGAWALFVDSAGQLWQGGDYSYSTTEGYSRQWSGGFLRHAQRDVSAPSTPTGLAGSEADGTVRLSWEAADDDTGVTSYEILRDDRVIASVTATTAEVPHPGTEARFFIRAVDAAGNRSASTAALRIDELPEAPVVETFISSGSAWSYEYTAAGPPGDWTAVDYDDSSWSVGQAPLGWGAPGLGTTITTTESPKPLVSFYRAQFEVEDMTRVVDLELTTRADDGIVVYVNGTEVERVRVDDGPAVAGTYANQAVTAAAAIANPVTVTVPGELLRTGTNVISASVHSNYRSTPSHSFELEATGEVSPEPVREAPPEEPEAPPTETVVAWGSPWSYLYDAAGPSGDWTAVEYDASSWSTGQAPLGWGVAGLGTTLTTTESPKPLVSFYRSAFEIEDMTRVVELNVTTRADDGLVLYVNGSEVERVRVDEGWAGAGTYANQAVTAAAAIANPVTVSVPGELLRTGTNVISASVHSNYRSTPSHSFELEAVAEMSEEPVREEPPEPPEAPVIETFVAPASSWSYHYDGTGPSGDWTGADYDDSSWETGIAPLGWGVAGLGTTVTSTASPKPLVSFYRSEFTVADMTRVVDLEITTRADDGLVLYVNGTEVERVRVDPGPVGAGTYANQAVSASAALANPVTVTVPGELLRTGTNVIAASVHSNYRSTPSHSFELEATGEISAEPLREEPIEAEEVPEPETARPAPEPSDSGEDTTPDPKPEPAPAPQEPTEPANPADPPAESEPAEPQNPGKEPGATGGRDEGEETG